MRKHLTIIGHISIWITSIFAIYFFKERVLYVDPGQQLFEMINEENYKVFVARYSMMINQTIPLIAIKMGLPLQWIMIIYSLSFVIIYYLCFLISVYKFKNLPAGLAIAFAPLIIRFIFGHSIAETWLGIGYAGLFYAALNYKKHISSAFSARKIPYYLLLLFLVLLNYFIHPSTLFLLGFAVGFTCVNKNQFTQSWPYILSIVILAIFSYRFFFTSFTYEENFFEGFKDSPKHLRHFWSSYAFKFMQIYFWTNYVWLAVLMMAAIGWNIWRKKYPQLLFGIGYIGIYLVIAALTFFEPTGEMAQETRLLPFIFMVVILLAEPLQKQKANYGISFLILLMITISFVQLFNQVKYYHTSRIVFYQKWLKETEQYPEKKFYSFKEKCVTSPLNSWGIAVETLMLTSMEDKSKSRTIYLFAKSEVPDTNAIKHPHMFLWVPWYTYYSEDSFNKKYFDLGDTPYRKIENPECNP